MRILGIVLVLVGAAMFVHGWRTRWHPGEMLELVLGLVLIAIGVGFFLL